MKGGQLRKNGASQAKPTQTQTIGRKKKITRFRSSPDANRKKGKKRFYHAITFFAGDTVVFLNVIS
jgi:hypothetical protein